VTRYLVEDDNNPTGAPQVFDELTNGVVTRSYAYGLQRIDEEQIVDNAWTPSYYGYDEGGSVRNLTNASGVVTDRYEYDAFGNSFTVSGTTPNNYLYRGEQHDADLGLYYLRARYYNPQSGRFTGVDPLSDQGQPRYEYAGADPVDGIDPLGTEDLIECALLGSNGLGTCSAPRLLAIHPPPLCDLFQDDPILSAAVGNAIPQCKCKKCFNTQVFAETLDTNAIGNTATTGPHLERCAHWVAVALREGGATISTPASAYQFNRSLPGAGFMPVQVIPHPSKSLLIASEQGDVTVFDKTSMLHHGAGHVEGFDGLSWVSYWVQRSWYGWRTYDPDTTATIYRSKCRCGHE
jgi:RHS repeat-associated protein